jgi:hypothetical protein
VSLSDFFLSIFLCHVKPSEEKHGMWWAGGGAPVMMAYQYHPPFHIMVDSAVFLDIIGGSLLGLTKEGHGGCGQCFVSVVTPFSPLDECHQTPV